MRKWRLPTIGELQRAYTQDKLKDFVEDYYWSSTASVPYTYTFNMHTAYSIRMGLLSTNRVRCVKTKKNGKLKWEKHPVYMKMSFEEALEYAERLNHKYDWRLPTVMELQDMVNCTQKELLEGFIGTIYWACPEDAIKYTTAYAAACSIATGSVTIAPRDRHAWLRCVRNTKEGPLDWHESTSRIVVDYAEALEYVEQLNKRR